MERISLLVGLLAGGSLVQCQQPDPIDNLIPTYGADLLPSYSEQATYNDLGAAATAPMSGEDMLRMSVPGNPGEDYPIYAEVPDTAFLCDGQVDGGYYADPEAECQAFHVCTADGNGGLAKYSFLCPNGTLFNQANFVCEYWFNVDCSQAESLYSLNDQIGVSEGSGGLDGSASSPSGGYAAPQAAAAPASGYSAAASDYSPPAPEDNFASAASAPASYEEEIDAGYGAPEQDTLAGYGGEERRGRKQGSRGGRRGRVGQQATKASSRPFGSRGLSNRKPSEEGVSRRKPAPIAGDERQGRARDKSGASRRGNSRPQGKVESRKGNKKANNRGSSKKAAGRPTVQAERGGRVGGASSRAGPSRRPDRTDRTDRPERPERTGLSQGRADQRRSGQRSNGRGLGRFGSKGLAESRRREGRGRGAGRGGRQEGGGAGDAYNAPALNTGYGAPPLDSSYASPDLEGSGSSSDDSYAAPAPEDSYGSPALDTGYGAPPPSYEGPSAAAAPAYEEPASDYDYEEEPLATYSGASSTAGQSNYVAPVSADSSYAAGASYGAPPPPPEEEYDETLGQADYEEDVLPTYNNGVYNDGSTGENYLAPEAADSYGAPAETEYGAPTATGNEADALGGYSDPEADILPEYFKSEISLGLNGASDVPRVEPFLSDYGVPQDTYAAASSFSPVAVESPARSVPDLTYGVPAAPTISLEDYNIPEVSDAGFSGVGGSSYGG